MKPMNLVKIWGVFCLMSIGLLTQGCVADDLSVCGISVRFKYTRNVDGIDKFASSINKINLYVFNEDGIFVEEYSEAVDTMSQGYSIFLNLTPGVYDFVAWGNLGEDYECPEFEKGVTHLNDLQLSLKRNAANAVSTLPGSLYHGGIFRKEIISLDLQFKQAIEIDMIKDTKEIKVISSGLALDAPTKAAEFEYGCSITSRNGDYRFDNSITGNTRLQYIPQEDIVGDENQLVSDFVIMREPSDRSTDSKLIVNQYSPSGDVEAELVNVDLVPILLAYAQEKDLELVDHFNIELFFDFTHSTYTISIPGWEGEVITGGIGVPNGRNMNGESK
jgi:hypothetical protein